MSGGKASAYASFFAWGRRTERLRWFRAWRSLGEGQASWCFGAVGPKTRGSALALERAEAHAVRLATGASWTVPYPELLERLALPPLVVRCLSAGLVFVFRCWAGLRPAPWAQCPLPPAPSAAPSPAPRRNPTRRARPAPSSLSVADQEASWRRHSLQLVVPACPLERVAGTKALPFIRTLRIWNALELLPEEEAHLLSATPTAAAWLKRNAPSVISRSASRIQALFPSFPLDAATLVSS